jgi:hypothetical protein
VDEEANARWLIDKDLQLYGTYLDITLKATAFVLAITGAITSYYLTHQGHALLVWSLAVPLLMNLGFLVLSVFSVFVATEMRERHAKHCADAGLGEAYNLGPLRAIIVISAGIFLCTSVGLGFLLLGWLP